MTEAYIAELRGLVDHLALHGVSWMLLKSGGLEMEITVAPTTAERAAAVSQPMEDVLSRGPGKFNHRHPVTGANMACLGAGDFLFPVASNLMTSDDFLAQEGAVVGYGTPLLRRASCGKVE